METTDPPIFLDVPALLESSEPRPRVPWLWYAAAMFGVMMLLSLFEKRSPQMRQAFEVISGLILFALMVLVGRGRCLFGSASSGRRSKRLRMSPS